jgi:4-amino-4-deoxy-L-arabinose transferase-like glycosyltransferase
MERTNKIYLWLSWLTIAIGIILRFLNLEADPPFWMDHFMADEATVIGAARNKYLFDSWIMDDMTYGYATPLLNLLVFFFIKFFGLSYFSVRFFSAFFGGLMLIVFFFLLKKYLSDKQTFIAIFFVSLTSLSVHFSRVALGESYLLFFFMVSLFFWFGSLNAESRKKNMLCLFSGFFFGISALFKISAVIHYPIYFVLWLLQYKRKEVMLKEVLNFHWGLFCTLPAWGLINFIQKGEGLKTFFIQGDINLLSPRSSYMVNFLNIEKFLTNLILGADPLLWFIFLTYVLWFISRLCANEKLASLNIMELLSLAIVCGGFLSTVWLKYQPEQRNLPFVWGLAISSSLLITNSRKISIDLEEIFDVLRRRPLWKQILWFSLSVFPFWFFVVYVCSGMSEKIPWQFGSKAGLSLWKLSALFSPIWILGVLFSFRSFRIWKALFLGSFISLALFGISRFLVNLQLYFGIGIDQVLGVDFRLKEVCFIVLPLVLLVFMVFLMSSTNKISIWENIHRLPILVLSIFFLFHFWQGMLPIIKPTFTLKEMGEYLAKKDLKRIFLVSHHSPLLLTRAHLIQLNTESRLRFYNLSRLQNMKPGDHFYNLANQIPPNDTYNIQFLNSWDKQFRIPSGSKLEGIYQLCPFGLLKQNRYVLALWIFKNKVNEKT